MRRGPGVGIQKGLAVMGDGWGFGGSWFTPICSLLVPMGGG